MQNKLQIHLTIVLFFSVAISQTLPQDFGFSRRANILLDAGYYHSSNSVFHPSIESSHKIHDSVAKPFDWLTENLEFNKKQFSYFAGISGISEKNKFGVSPFFFGNLQKNRFYAQLYLRATNDSSLMTHYSGVPRRISRFGLKSAEVDRAVIGFQNNWLQVEFGRNREIWGISNDKNLILSGNSPAYERLILQVNFSHFSYRYFGGFLESKNDENKYSQRYIVGRGLEYKRRKNLVISAGEVSILSGDDRSIDWAFANPLGFHLEIEQNQRSNVPQGNRENAIWFTNVDWFATENIRFAGSVILDEFQLDFADRERGRSDALGFSFHGAWTPFRQPFGLTIIADWVRIGTYVFQHEHPNCNFVTRGKLLGHPLGNDAEEFSGGLRFIFPIKFFIETKLGYQKRGENSLLLQGSYAPFEEFTVVDFPSGAVEESTIFQFIIDAQPMRFLRFETESTLNLTDFEKSTFRIELEVMYQ